MTWTEMISQEERLSRHQSRLAARNTSLQQHNKLLFVVLTFVTTLLTCHQLSLPLAHSQTHHQHHAQRAAGSSQACHKEGWQPHNDRCYKIQYTPRNLDAARSRCMDLGSELVLIEEPEVLEAPSIEEEASPSQRNTTSLINFLTHIMKADFHNRLFYVNISRELARQYHQNIANTRPSAELTEHIESDYSISHLWLPTNDTTFASARLDPRYIKSNETTGFALGRSSQSDKWGLVPISPARKALSICEMALAGHQAKHHARAHSLAGAGEHGANEAPKRTLDHTAGQIAPESHSAGHKVTFFGAEGKRDREAIPSSQPAEVLASVLFRDLPQNQSVVMGSTSEMRCSPIDNDSTLYWTVDGKNVTQSNRIKLHSNGTLKIDHVRNKDGGLYTCTIHSAGSVESRSARLEILERPHHPDYITAELLDKLSTSVRVQWMAGFNGNSPITKYQVEMRTVSSDNLDSDLVSSTQSGQWEVAKANVSADQTSVIVADLKPARKYIFRVRADNRIGTSDPSLPTRPPIEVPVQPPSMAPENLSGTPRSPTSISIQWSPPPADSQNGLIKAYKIRHKLAGYASDTAWYMNDLAEASHLSYVLDDLITWQNYEIQVAAENDKGVGPFSSSVFVRTKEGKPDKGPRNVVAESVFPTVLKVTWNPPPPQHINGINLGYRVQVWQDADQNQLIKEAVVAHNSLTPLQATTVDGLLPYTEYYVTVKCMTNGGDGVPNEELVTQRTKQDLPEAVAALEFHEVLDKSLRVSWRPPVHANGELDHYVLEYMELDSSDRKMSKKFPVNINEARIQDLSPQTRYTFAIYAHNSVGKGPARVNNTKTSVPPVLPEPPSNLRPKLIGPYSVLLEFEPGFNGNAAIDKWICEALTPSKGDYKPRWQNVYISTNHSEMRADNLVHVRNLRPYTRYKIRLTPVNVVGASRYASEPTDEFTTSQIEPEEAPRDLSVEEVKATSVLARWSPLGNNKWSGLARGYNLTWSESNNSTVSFQMINDTRADSFHVHDLEEFTEYVFHIYAVNEAGSSFASEPVLVTTLEDVPSSGPTNLTAHALSSTAVSVDWNAIPKRHRNGLIRGYKVQYQADRPNAPLQYKSVEENNTKHATLTDLKPNTLYHLAVAASTSAGNGVYGPIVSVQTLEDTPGMPQNLSSPTVSQNSARILWDPPEDSNGDILGYKISYHAITETSAGSNSKDTVSHELHHNERTFKATNLKPDTHYLFTVTAKTKEGWGQQASTLIYTYDSELRANLPFFRESWFVIMCACLSVVITIIVTALLFIQTKSYKYRQDVVKSSQDRLGDAGFTIDDEPVSHYDNGFGLLPNSANHRRSNGALSQSTANFTLPKTPPRPHPGSVVYSDNGDDDVFEEHIGKPVTSVAGSSRYNDDSSGDSLTEKPGESSSTAPDSESADDEYANMAARHFTNHYANVNGTLRSQKSWKNHGATGKNYASHRTTPKLPQRPAPSVPKVPGDHSQSSSDNASSQPSAGPSGMQSAQQNRTNGVYGDLHQIGHSQPEPNMRTLSSNKLSSQQMVNGSRVESITSETSKLETQQNTQNQQLDMLNNNNNHIVSLNGGRIIVDNMAGSRAPLPGFTSFV